MNPAAVALIDRGPLLHVTISLHPLDSAGLLRLGQSVPPPIHTSLLVDTGAPHSLVEREIIDPLGLVPHGFYTFRARGAGFEQHCPIRRCRLAIHTGGGPVVLDTVIATTTESCFPEGSPFRGLLGRSSLQHLRFVYDGPAGTFEIRKP